MHLGRFLHFSEKVVGVTLKMEAFSSNFHFPYRAKFRIEQNSCRFLHFCQKEVRVNLKNEAFSSKFQFKYRAKFSTFG